jgi:hypothetical protein
MVRNANDCFYSVLILERFSKLYSFETIAVWQFKANSFSKCSPNCLHLKVQQSIFRLSAAEKDTFKAKSHPRNVIQIVIWNYCNLEIQVILEMFSKRSPYCLHFSRKKCITKASKKIFKVPVGIHLHDTKGSLSMHSIYYRTVRGTSMLTPDIIINLLLKKLVQKVQQGSFCTWAESEKYGA